MNFKIRHAEDIDYIELNKLILEVHKLHVHHRPDVYIDTDNPLEIEPFKESLNNKDIDILVIYETHTNKLVGYSEVERISLKNRRLLKNKNITMIEAFCISNCYRMQGLGKMLFNHIVKDAKKNKSDLIQLVVWDFNKDAIEFYKSLGMNNRNIRMELPL